MKLVKKLVTRITMFCAVLAILNTTALRAQMTEGATASMFNYNGSWNLGTEQTQSFPLVYFGAHKDNIFSIGAREIIDPGVFNIYGALGNYQPDISKLLAKTTLNPTQFNISFDVVGGLATMAGGITSPALEGRINAQYALTPNTSLSGAYAGGGLIGQNRFGVVSAGFAYVFGAPANTQSVAKKAFIKHYALVHHSQ